MRIEEALTGVQRLALDSAPLIYLVERHPTFGPISRRVIEFVEERQILLLTSSLTLTEVLAKPLASGEAELAATYRALLLATPYLRVEPVGQEVAEAAARLRADHGFKTPDAIQLAVAAHTGCDAFLTNDSKLARALAPRVLVLSDLVT